MLGVSLATLDRRVIPTIATVQDGVGRRLIPVGELERYLAERREAAASTAAPPRAVRAQADAPARCRRAHPRRAGRGSSLAEIARGLNHDGIPTGQGGRQWWPSTVR